MTPAKISQITTLIVTVLATVGAAQYAQTWTSHHELVFAVLAALAQIVHALFPSLGASSVQKKLPMLFVALALGLAAAQPARAQVTVQTAAVASGINWQGNWYAATETTEQIPLFYAGATKNNIFSVGSRQLLVPGQFTSYLALANFQPDLSALLAKTPIGADQLQVSFDVGGGVTTFSSTNPAQPTVAGRVNVAYNFSASNALTTGFVEGGFIGQQKFWGVSAGWEHIFNATNANGNSNSPAAAMKHLVLRAKAKLAARDAAQQ